MADLDPFGGVPNRAAGAGYPPAGQQAAPRPAGRFDFDARPPGMGERVPPSRPYMPQAMVSLQLLVMQLTWIIIKGLIEKIDKNRPHLCASACDVIRRAESSVAFQSHISFPRTISISKSGKQDTTQKAFAGAR